MVVYACARWLYFSAGLLFAALAVFAAWGGARRDEASARFRELDHARWSAVLLGVAFPAFFALLKLADLRSFRLSADSGETVHLLWRLANGYGWTSSDLGGLPYLAIHFAFTTAPLAALMRLWPGAAPLALAQGAAVGSSIYAVYLLAERRCGDTRAAWLLATLVASHHLFQDLTATFVDNGPFAFPLFLWAAYCWESGRRGVAAALAAAFLTTKESAPFAFAGLGLYWVLRREDRRPGPGAALAAAAALLWLAELRLMSRARGASDCFDNWNLFPALGGNAQAVAWTAAHKPWAFIVALAWPPEKLWTPLRVLAPFAFAPAFAPAQALPALVAWIPHQLAAGDSAYHRLLGHHPAILGGPLVWAAVIGFDTLRQRLGERGRRWLVSGMLAAAAYRNFAFADFYRGGWLPSSWTHAVPALAARIPGDSKLWCDGYLLPQLGERAYVKTLPLALPSCFFERGLFVPDHILLSTYGLRQSTPEARDRLLGFIRREGFETIAQERDLVLLRHPDADGVRAAEPRPLKL